MKKTQTELSILLAGMVIVCLLCIAPAMAQQRFTISGAGLLTDLTEGFTKEYGKVAPKCSSVVFPATTGKGFRRFISGEADMVMASRKMTDDEEKKAKAKGIAPEFKLMGRVCVAVITKAGNPVKELTMEQLGKVFVGEIKNWKELGGADQPIKVTTRAVPETGTGVHFQKVVLKGAPYAPGHEVMPRYSTTMTVCSKSNAIGYVPASSGSFYKGKESVDVIGIKADADSKAVFPKYGVAKTSDYPVTIPFYFYWNSKSDKVKCLSGFAEFAAGRVK
ncbi:substrate-binding domain-containing protein [Thermodesulfobacteriota bacterium]